MGSVDAITALVYPASEALLQCLRSLINLSNSKPHLFYPLLFLYTYQIADMFSSSRALAIDVLKLI